MPIKCVVFQSDYDQCTAEVGKPLTGLRALKRGRGRQEITRARRVEWPITVTRIVDGDPVQIFHDGPPMGEWNNPIYAMAIEVRWSDGRVEDRSGG